MAEEYAYVIEELITEKPEVLNKEAYYESIINTTVELGTAEEFIVVLSELIQRLAVDHLHVLGDIYDRGAGPHQYCWKMARAVTDHGSLHRCQMNLKSYMTNL